MSTRGKIQSYLEGISSDAVLLDPEVFDEAILGLIDVAGGESVVVYDRQRVIEILMRDTDRDGAEEYFEFNIAPIQRSGWPVFCDTRWAE